VRLLEECQVLKGQIAEIKYKLIISKDQNMEQFNRLLLDFSEILAKIDCLEKTI
jgi:hypothetical protein